MFKTNKHSWMLYNYITANDNIRRKMWIRGHDTIHETEEGYVAKNESGKVGDRYISFEEAEKSLSLAVK